MSKVIAVAASRGSHAIVAEAEQKLEAAVQKHGEAQALEFPETAFFLPMAHALLGLDGQMSNWALHDGKLLYMDVTTPLMRDAQGRELLDTELFMKSLPWALRGLVRRFFLGEIIDKYYLPRGVILDILGNLLKENLAKLIPTCLEQANVRLPEAIQESEVHRYYRSDAKMWALMQRLRRADRWWQRRIRRRTYPFLLPGKISRNL